jgi:ribosome-binding protein aMBF1 (putative translation factor)
MKLSELRTGRQVLEDHLKDPAFREEWERTALGRAVAIRIVRYRVDHGLSQARLAKVLGMKQPAVARLEDGGTNPTVETLMRISKALGIEFLLDIAPDGQRTLAGKRAERAAIVQSFTSGGSSVLVAIE